MMRIGLIDVDGHNFPNLALGKVARYYHDMGGVVEWYSPFEQYNVVYMSKVFSFTPDYLYPIINAKRVERGGTGYNLQKNLPEEIDRLQPLYSLYPKWDSKTAFGFLTRGCIRKCPWCVVPRKEGSIKPYMDIDELMIEGRNRAVLMDNNVLASDYGLLQIEKIAERGYRVDFNQALDARLVTPEIAKLLAKVKWLDHNRIRFGCDTKKQIEDCERAIELINSYGFRGEYFLYTIIGGYSDFAESFHRVDYWHKRMLQERKRHGNQTYPYAQPYLNPDTQVQHIPQWQKDLAGWCDKRWIFTQCEFKDFQPRKGFRCEWYLKNLL